MAILGIASVFVCLMFLCNSILQASGFVNLPIIVMAVGCVAKLGVNNFLVRRDGIGVVGAPIGTLVCYIIVAGLELYLIKRVIPQAPSYRKTFIKPFLASLIMGGAAWAAGGLLESFLLGIKSFQFVAETGQLMLSRVGYGLVTMGSIGVAVVVYGVVIVALRAITREDLSLMPKGDKIAKVLRLKD
jgi:stage V sporulation protein B